RLRPDDLATSGIRADPAWHIAPARTALHAGRVCLGETPCVVCFILRNRTGESVMAQFVTDFGTTGTPNTDGRLDAPAFHRNWRPIWSVLAGHLQDKAGDVLEVGSGTGQHVVE